MKITGYSHQMADAAIHGALDYIAPQKHPDNQTSERFQFSLSPSVTTNSNQSGSYNQWLNGGNASTSSNAYALPGQAALQGQTAQGYSNLLQGNIPTSFTANPNLVGAYTTAFNQNAPSMAFQGGAGSPQMQSNYAQGLQSLLANQYNTGVNNYQNSLAGAQSYGTTTSGASNEASNQSYGRGNSIGTYAGVEQQPLSLLQLLGAAGTGAQGLQNYLNP